jgi:hypothetical protein
MELPDNYIIHDTRVSKDLKGITIGGYKRADVLKAYQNSMINNKLEDSIRWCVELHSTGLNEQIWNSLKIIYFKYIHINNPRYFFYLFKREKDYNRILRDYIPKHEVFTRNNQEIRNLYAELTALSTVTKKNNIFLQKSLPTINNKSFEKYEIKKRIISKNMDYVYQYITIKTTSEMKLVFNEIYNNLLSKKGTIDNCIYWYLWLEKIENIKKKDNKILNNIDKIIDNNDHWTFIIWKIILNFQNVLEKKDIIYLEKLENIYKKNFKVSQISSKKYYIFIAFLIIKNNINWNIPLQQYEHLIIQTNANINKMYRNIISSITSKLSIESKELLYKNYNKIYIDNFKNKNIIKPKKIVKNFLDNDINRVIYTKYPQYKIINKNNEDNNKDNKDNNKNNNNEDNNLISKNMTLRDIIEAKEERKNKKISAFKDFVVFKKEIVNKEIKNIENNDIEIKEIKNNDIEIKEIKNNDIEIKEIKNNDNIEKNIINNLNNIINNSDNDIDNNEYKFIDINNKKR